MARNRFMVFVFVINLLLVSITGCATTYNLDYSKLNNVAYIHNIDKLEEGKDYNVTGQVNVEEYGFFFGNESSQIESKICSGVEKHFPEKIKQMKADRVTDIQVKELYHYPSFCCLPGFFSYNVQALAVKILKENSCEKIEDNSDVIYQKEEGNEKTIMKNDDKEMENNSVGLKKKDIKEKTEDTKNIIQTTAKKITKGEILGCLSIAVSLTWILFLSIVVNSY